VSNDSRQLIVMRHAKAEPFAASDHSRVLLPRGERDAVAAGQWAVSAQVRPDYVVVSSAARTQGTWAGFSAAYPEQPEAVTDRSLYAAGTEAAFEILRTVPEEARSVMVIGHNPTMEELVHVLDDGEGDPEVLATLSAGYPTSAVSVLDISTTWSGLEPESGRLRLFHVGRG
jgi:phosphohistidine phosphatase